MIENIKDIVTIIGFFIGLPAIIITFLTYRKKVKLDQVKFIHKIYKEFDSEEIANLYAKIIHGKLKKIKTNSPDESALCKVLAIFDNIYNYYEQGIINDEILSYIACEIIDFYDSALVSKYIEVVHNDCLEKNFKEDIWPYTGLNELRSKVQNYIIDK